MSVPLRLVYCFTRSMSHHRRIDGSTQQVAEELSLLRKLASQRRQASWQSVVEQSRKRANDTKLSGAPSGASANRIAHLSAPAIGSGCGMLSLKRFSSR
jgi:hypothetical protein